MTRTSTSIASVLPTGRTWFSCSTRSSLTCSRIGMSPISSSSRVPPSAAWNSPSWSRVAPVKAPLTCPNSSDSSRSSAIALQLIATNGLSCRGLARWIALASSSLPVPLWPVISTRASVAATILACARISLSFWLRVMISDAQSSSTSGTEPDTFMARSTVSMSSSLSIGLVRKPNAPLWVAVTASGMVPCAVMMTGPAGPATWSAILSAGRCRPSCPS